MDDWGMPALVEANGGPSPWDSAPLAGTTQWPTLNALGASPRTRSRGAPNDTAVIPGGFGAGTPRPARHKQPRGTPAPPGFGTFGRSPSAASVHNPWLAAPLAAPPAPDPFQFPASAFDQPYQGQGTPYPMQGGGGGGFGAPPPQGPPAGFGATPSWYTPRTHAQGFEFEDEEGSPEEGENPYPRPPPAPGLGGWGGSQADPWAQGDPWGFGGKIAGTPSMDGGMGAGYASGPRSQYKRPEEWRSDFTMGKPSGGLTRFFSKGKGSKEGAVHWTLDAKGAGCTWDIRRAPGNAFFVLPENRTLTYLELQEGAMTPAPLRMRLVHPKLPWTVHVSASPGSVITVSHLLWTLHRELLTPVTERDFWNDDVSEGDRKEIHAAWAARCAGDREMAMMGVKRVDFLGDRWVFEGIRRAGDNWEMKLKSGRGRN